MNDISLTILNMNGYRPELELENRMISPNSFEDLWEDEDLADVVLYVGDESTTDVWRIAAHQMVLSVYSPVFEKMFYMRNSQDSPEQQNEDDREKETKSNENIELLEIFITDVPPELFDQLLRFMYTNNLQLDTVNSANLLLEIARKYEVKSAIDIIVPYLLSQLDFKNFFVFFKSSTEISHIWEKTYQRVILDKDADLIKTNGFCYQTEEIIKYVISVRKQDSDSQLTMVDGLFRWSVTECKRRGLVINDENKLNVLKNINESFNFNAASSNPCLDGLFKRRMLNVEDKLKSLFESQSEETFSVSRFKGTLLLQRINSKEKEIIRHHCLLFTSDTPLLLNSVSFVGNKEILDYEKNFYMMLLKKSSEIIAEIELKTAVFNKYKFALKFPIPVEIKSNIAYQLYIKMPDSYAVINAENVKHRCDWSFGDKKGHIFWSDCSIYSGERNHSTSKTGQLFELELALL